MMKMQSHFLFLVVLIIGATDATDCNQPPKPVDFKNCCTKPNLISVSVADKCKQYKEDSTNTFFNPCYMDCVFNETGILQNNEVNMEKAKAYLEEVLGANKEFKPVVEQAFVKCVEKSKEWREKLKGMPPPSKPMPVSPCKPHASMLYGCVMFEIFLTCPEIDWNKDKNPDCDAARDFIVECKPELEKLLKGPPKN